MPVAPTLPTLVTGGKCFNCLSKSEKKAIQIYFLALALKAAGGTDYTNVNTLRSAEICPNCNSEPALDSFDVEIAQNLAINLGGAANLTIAQLKALTARMISWGPKEMHAAETLLRNALTAFNA